jgi:6-phosphogluconolactonase (cycloisomerase 2 family)
MRSRLQHGRASAAVLVGAALAAGGCGSMRSCASPPPRPDGRYLYVVHDGRGSIAPGVDPHVAAFQVDPATGALRAVDNGSTGARAVGAFSLAVDPSGRWFSLAGSQLGLLRLTASGAVEPAAPERAGGLSAYFDARGRFFFLVTGQGLEVFRFDAARGVDLSAPLHTEAGALSLVLGGPRDGSLLYAGGEDFRAYTVGERGALALAPGSPHTLPVRALELAVHPSGRFVLVFGEARGRRLIVVLRAGADGSLEEADGSPFDPGNDARSMALSADGAYVFVTDRDRHSIETFGLDAAGGLHAVASTPMDVAEAGELVVDAESRYLYAGSMKAGTVEAFAIEPTGALAPVPGSPFAVGPRAGSLVTTPLADGPLQAALLPEAGAFAGRSAPVRADASTFATASLDSLVDALGDPSDDTRYFAISAMVRHTDIDAAVPAVIAALDDPHPPVSRTARLILGPWALTHPGQVDDEVLGRLVGGANGRGVALDNASLTALHALKNRGAAASPYLARSLVNSGQLRDEAVDALISLGPAAAPAVPELRRLLQHSQARRDAAAVLGWIGPGAAEAVPELYALLQDPSPSVQRTAKMAIERIRGQR